MGVLNIDEDPFIQETYVAPGKMNGPQPLEFLQQTAYHFASGAQLTRDLLMRHTQFASTLLEAKTLQDIRGETLVHSLERDSSHKRHDVIETLCQGSKHVITDGFVLLHPGRQHLRGIHNGLYTTDNLR